MSKVNFSVRLTPKIPLFPPGEATPVEKRSVMGVLTGEEERMQHLFRSLKDAGWQVEIVIDGN